MNHQNDCPNLFYSKSSNHKQYFKIQQMKMIRIKNFHENCDWEAKLVSATPDEMINLFFFNFTLALTATLDINCQ